MQWRIRVLRSAAGGRTAQGTLFWNPTCRPSESAHDPARAAPPCEHGRPAAGAPHGTEPAGGGRAAQSLPQGQHLSRGSAALEARSRTREPLPGHPEERRMKTRVCQKLLYTRVPKKVLRNTRPLASPVTDVSRRAASSGEIATRNPRRRCEDCLLNQIQALQWCNDELIKWIERYHRALAEADRQNVALVQLGLSVRRRRVQ